MDLRSLSHDRRFLYPFIALVIFLLYLFFSTESVKTEISWATIQQAPFTVEAIETGEVRAIQQQDVKAPMEWRMSLQVVSLAPEGKLVQAGDVLVQFDIAELEKRLDVANDRLTSALAQQEKLLAEQQARNQELQGNLLTAEYSRDIAVLQQDLYKYEAEVKRQDAELERLKALIQLDEAKTTLESQKIIDAAALSSARLEIAKARLEKRGLERQIENMTLRAPISGMLVYNEVGWWDNQKKVSVGDKVNAGEPIVSIPNLDSMQVTLRVNEMDISRIKDGQEAVIILDAYPEKRYHGRVAQIARLGQKENWNTTIKDFEVVVRLQESDPLLKPGMTARAIITIDKLDNACFVPMGAIFEQDNKPVVFTRKKYPAPLPVSLGERTEDWIVVQGEGIAAGEAVALRTADSRIRRIGFARYAQYTKTAEEKWQKMFEEMLQRGLRYDYDASRGQPPAVGQPGNGPHVPGLPAGAHIMQMGSGGSIHVMMPGGAAASGTPAAPGNVKVMTFGAPAGQGTLLAPDQPMKRAAPAVTLKNLKSDSTTADSLTKKR
jgi:RND family efflux transporter MFP subunit